MNLLAICVNGLLNLSFDAVLQSEICHLQTNKLAEVPFWNTSNFYKRNFRQLIRLHQNSSSIRHLELKMGYPVAYCQ